MTGKLFGVGVGPGDPELLTLKAVKRIKESSCIAYLDNKDKQTALEIAKKAVPELVNKQLVQLSFPMKGGPSEWKKHHQLAAEEVIRWLQKGMDVCFLTLGDPTVYSSYLYVHKIVRDAGYEAEIIAGVPSFCAVAARLGESLVEGNEQLHIIPAPYEGMEQALSLPGTKVLMKAGRKMEQVKKSLGPYLPTGKVLAVECCGMDEERIISSLEELNTQSSYFTTLLIKEIKDFKGEGE